MKRIAVAGKVIIACALLAVNARCIAAEPSADYTKEALDALVKDLGSEEFEKRQTAEKELTKAGVKAKEALTAAQTSADPQVKASAGRLLARLKLESLGPINYLDVIPANTIVGAHVTNLAASVENAKKTTIGKLILSSELEPFRAKVDEATNRDPAARKKALEWFGRFQGQAAASVWELNFMAGPGGISAGLIAEITDPDPRAVFGDFLEDTGIGADAQKGSYKEVETLEHPRGDGAIALVGKHLVLASNPASLHRMIDGILKPGGGMSGSAVYTKVKPSLGAKPDLQVFLDLDAYVKLITGMMPIPGVAEMIESSGLGDVQLLVISAAVAGDAFEERYVVQFKKAPSGMQAAQVPPETAAPIGVTSLLPGNAVGAVVGYLDGEKLGEASSKYIDGLKKLMQFQQQMGGGQDAPDIDAIIKEIETKLEIKIDEITKSIKGEFAYWAVLAPPPGLAPPDIGMLTTCVDADKAKLLASIIARTINTASEKQAVQEVAHGTRTLYSLDLTQLKDMPPNVPYAPAWTAEGNRIIGASSIQALKKQLANIENKAPGLLTQPDFVKALGALTAEERKGQIVYVDMKSLLVLGGTVGLPLLQTQMRDEELKNALAALPKPQDLFKDIPPLLASSIYKGDQAITIVRAPVPPIPTFFGLVFVASFARSAGGMGGGGAIAPGPLEAE